MVEEQPVDACGAPAEGRRRLHLLQVAGGDSAFAAKLCEMLWHEYSAAGCPLGISEEGMFRWLMQKEQSLSPSGE